MNATSVGPQRDALFSALIAVAVDGIIVIDEKGCVKTYNGACERLFGYSPEEVVGHDIAMLMPEPHRSQHPNYIARYLATNEKRIIGIGREAVGRRKDGTIFPMYISVGEGMLDQSRIFVGVVHDITERKARQHHIEELQRNLHHATRLSAMGQLSSAIAHELSQPLTACLNYANAAQNIISRIEGDAAAQAREAVGKAATQIVRAREIIRRLRDFVEKRERTRGAIDINNAVREAVALGMIGTVGTAISVETELAPGLPPVLGDAVQIQQVLINLMLNAVDAMQDQPHPKLRVSTCIESDAMIRVAVVDNGAGLSDAAKLSLFQPFVTTKPTGAGMGLSICRAIVEAHGGRLWAEEAPGGGMIFQFLLPVHHGDKPATA